MIDKLEVGMKYTSKSLDHRVVYHIETVCQGRVNLVYFENGVKKYCSFDYDERDIIKNINSGYAKLVN